MHMDVTGSAAAWAKYPVTDARPVLRAGDCKEGRAVREGIMKESAFKLVLEGLQGFQ